MDAMMQTWKQKVEKFFVFFITKLGLLHSPPVPLSFTPPGCRKSSPELGTPPPYSRRFRQDEAPRRLLLVSSSSPHPGAPPHAFVPFFPQPYRVDHPRPTSPAPRRTPAAPLAAAGRERPRLPRLCLPHVAPQSVVTSSRLEHRRGDEHIHARAAAAVPDQLR